MSASVLFIAFTALAFLLFFAEMFVPGGVLGFIGGSFLLLACGCAVVAFGPAMGLLVAFLLIALALAGGMFWLSKMPDTRIGKRFALSHHLENEDSASPSPYLGETGIAETDLRPGGFARIEGQKLDVVATRGYVEAGAKIQVKEVHGSRIVVQPMGETGE